MRGGLSISTLRRMRNHAERMSARPDEAEDLVQDVLLAAVSQGRSVHDEKFLAWAFGAIRLHARFVARGAVRRRRRETEYSTQDRAPTEDLPHLPEAFVSTLPPSLQILARLVALGLGRGEITYLLSVSDTAFRQRVRALRKAVASAGIGIDSLSTSGPARTLDGLRRRGLIQALERHSGHRIAVADPDGQNILLTVAHILPAAGNRVRS